MRRAEMEKMEAQHEAVKYTFVRKLSDIPMVNMSVEAMSGVYEKVKNSHSLVTSTVGLAESVTSTVYNKVTPLAQKGLAMAGDPLAKVDGLASKGLDKVTTTVPVIMKTPSDMVKDTKDTINAKMAPVYETYNKTTEVVFDNKVAKITFDACEYVIATANKTLDMVLPPGDGEKSKTNNQTSPDEPTERPYWLVKQSLVLAATAAHRMFGAAQNGIESASNTSGAVYQSTKKAMTSILPESGNKGKTGEVPDIKVSSPRMDQKSY